jgi:hypothetical protein
VTSGSSTVEVWEVESATTVSLLKVSSGAISSGQDGGFFTSVSSNGRANAIIWALGRPVSSGQPLTLYAFNPDMGGSTLTPLFQSSAGSWTNYISNANLVPVVANGEVFVASYQQLQIFGLVPPKTKVVKNKHPR